MQKNISEVEIIENSSNDNLVFNSGKKGFGSGVFFAMLSEISKRYSSVVDEDDNLVVLRNFILKTANDYNVNVGTARALFIPLFKLLKQWSKHVPSGGQISFIKKLSEQRGGLANARKILDQEDK